MDPRRAARRAVHYLPSLAIFAALGGLLVWGHRTGWTLPSFATLLGRPAPAADDWCVEHNVPDSICVECKPDLMPRPKAHGWCGDHGVHVCPLCHPAVAQLAKPARVSTEDLARAERALAFKERPENNPLCKLHLRRIQFASAEAVEKAGVGVDTVWTAPVVESVGATGEVVYEQTRTARLSAKVPGTVFRALKQVGDAVRGGEVVALVDAAEVGRVKAEFLQALIQVRLKAKAFDDMQRASAGGSFPVKTLREQETALSEARIRLTTSQQALTNLGLPIDAESLAAIADDKLGDRLRFLGLPDGLARFLDPRAAPGSLLPVASPIEGVIAQRDVVAGEVVDIGKVLFTVVDPRSMWLTLDVRLEDAAIIALGNKVRFRPDGAKADSTGSLDWISTEADHKTRTVKVRATLANADGRLRANAFGLGRIVLREEPKAVVVPSVAVHFEGDCHVVFVRDKDYLRKDAPKVFHTRTVRLGARDERTTEIVAGVLPGEIVAAKGSAALRAELLRGSLGEG